MCNLTSKTSNQNKVSSQWRMSVYWTEWPLWTILCISSLCICEFCRTNTIKRTQPSSSVCIVFIRSDLSFFIYIDLTGHICICVFDIMSLNSTGLEFDYVFVSSSRMQGLTNTIRNFYMVFGTIWNVCQQEWTLVFWKKKSER